MYFISRNEWTDFFPSTITIHEWTLLGLGILIIRYQRFTDNYAHLKNRGVKKMKKQIKVGIYLPSATILFYPNEGAEVAGGAEINCYNLALEMAKSPNYNVSFYVMD